MSFMVICAKGSHAYSVSLLTGYILWWACIKSIFLYMLEFRAKNILSHFPYLVKCKCIPQHSIGIHKFTPTGVIMKLSSRLEYMHCIVMQPFLANMGAATLIPQKLSLISQSGNQVSCVKDMTRKTSNGHVMLALLAMTPASQSTVFKGRAFKTMLIGNVQCTCH